MHRNITTGEGLDRWCAALVLYFVLEGRIAFNSRGEITTKSLPLSRPHSDAYLDFIKHMLHKHPEHRLNSYGINNHLWIRQ